MTSQAPTPRAGKDLLPALTGIRGFAATWVIVEHFWKYIEVFAPELRFLQRYIVTGFLSVEIFFTLSGFIIAYNYADELSTWSRTKARKFIVNRLARIYPVHFVTLIGAAALLGGAKVLGIRLLIDVERTPLSFLWNVLLLHGVFYTPAFNSPAWSVSVEFMAYVAFPLIAIALVWFKTTRSSFTGAAFVLLAGTSAMLAIGHWVNPGSTGRGMFWARIATEFIAGCLLWKGWSLMQNQFGRWGDWLVWGSLAALVVFLIGVDATDTLVPETFAATPIMALMVFGCAAAVGSARRVFGSRTMVWSGRVSYSLYLTHFLVLIPVGKIFPSADHADLALPLKLLWIVFWLVLCYVVAHLMYTLVEEPGRRLIRARFLREGPPVEDPLVSGPDPEQEQRKPRSS